MTRELKIIYDNPDNFNFGETIDFPIGGPPTLKNLVPEGALFHIDFLKDNVGNWGEGDLAQIVEDSANG